MGGTRASVPAGALCLLQGCSVQMSSDLHFLHNHFAVVLLNGDGNFKACQCSKEGQFHGVDQVRIRVNRFDEGGKVRKAAKLEKGRVFHNWQICVY